MIKTAVLAFLISLDLANAQTADITSVLAEVSTQESHNNEALHPDTVIKHAEKKEEGLEPPFTTYWWICVAVALCKSLNDDNCLVCTCWGGLMSGLTVGLLSIDELELELKKSIGTDIERRQVSL